ncbi:acyl-CoA carboxylase subunit epsilon [Haloglycomyces albus]|uniref:acyl-CoA carboxylase subunit epsilon n=1 Tax=Haloglycomyces albus TaxID=526067 RepID=UPI00046CA360|nr:acyl-CoA carboxylase subunit epsilon [Haloglycomyces albus]
MTTDTDTQDVGIRVTRGNPTAEETAVITALLYSLAGSGDDEPAVRRTPSWSDPGLKLRVRRSWRDTAIPARRGMER